MAWIAWGIYSASLLIVIMTKILIRVEEALHKALKIKAIKEGISMERAVNVAIERYVGEGVEEAEGMEG